MTGIEIKGLTKAYGKTVAADNISLTLEHGKIYGLLGRNGAGKTTLLNAISGRIFPDSGTIAVDGQAAIENDSALGKLYLMSEQTLYPEKMKVREAFKWSALFYPDFDLEYANGLAKSFSLDVNKRVKALSTGYTSIFKLIVALAAGTPYILLDEPVLGLDANHRDLFYRTVLERYSNNPCTIVISTHLVEEVSALLEDVVIIKSGRVLYSGGRDQLLARGYTVSGPAGAVDAFAKGRELLGEDSLGGLKTAYIMGTPPDDAQGVEIAAMDLQKLFVRMTND